LSFVIITLAFITCALWRHWFNLLAIYALVLLPQTHLNRVLNLMFSLKSLHFFMIPGFMVLYFMLLLNDVFFLKSRVVHQKLTFGRQ
jgi:hypothetical protein